MGQSYLRISICVCGSEKFGIRIRKEHFAVSDPDPPTVFNVLYSIHKPTVGSGSGKIIRPRTDPDPQHGNLNVVGKQLELNDSKISFLNCSIIWRARKYF